MKPRPIKVNNKVFDSVAQAARYLNIYDSSLWRWIKKYGKKFKSGDLEIEVL